MALIGISGKIGVGKDTVGKIIQYLTDDTVNKTVYPNFEEFDKLDIGNEGYHPWQIKKYAGKLKTIASLLTGVPVEKFEDQEFKKQMMPEGWGMTYRTFLQKLGTEGMRVGVHTNVWVNALFADYKGKKTRINQLTPVKQSFDVDTYPKWIITDMRFPNEMEAVKQRDGITIRVTRKLKIGGEDYGYTYVDVKQAVKDGIIAPEHPSETALDDAEFDYEIINDGTIDDLVEKVREILIKEKLI